MAVFFYLFLILILIIPIKLKIKVSFSLAEMNCYIRIKLPILKAVKINLSRKKQGASPQKNKNKKQAKLSVNQIANLIKVLKEVPIKIMFFCVFGTDNDMKTAIVGTSSIILFSLIKNTLLNENSVLECYPVYSQNKILFDADFSASIIFNLSLIFFVVLRILVMMLLSTAKRRIKDGF